MPDRITWFATFDGAQARFFDFSVAHRRLAPVEAMMGPHRPDRDGPLPRTQESATPRRAAIEPKTDAERALETAFVRTVAERLDTMLREARFSRLIVAAGPRALGAFRQHASPTLRASVIVELDRCFANTPPDEIARALADHL